MSTIAASADEGAPARPWSIARYEELSGQARIAVERDKSEGLRLAVRSRWAALAIVAALAIYLNQSWDVVYYLGIIAGFALIGWAQLHVGRAGRSRPELLLMFCDVALMTVTASLTNPLLDHPWPASLVFRQDGFMYFYVLLAAAMLSYTWRTVITMGVWTAVLWTGAVAWAYFQADPIPELTSQVRQALQSQPQILATLDPASIRVPARVQELVVFLIVAGMLTLGGWRTNRLLMSLAATERERTNLARYFSPNVVDELAQHDEPLKQVRSQNVAVLFADIVGFTRYAERQRAEAVVDTLREFHALMENQVFGHGGTLDKYLGDGLMATFGTPITGPDDARNAMRCARAMVEEIGRWNAMRAKQGEEPISLSVGVHFGEAVLGDIGSNRLEYAVIGNTVNVASRLEALTRQHGTAIIVSDDLVREIRSQPQDGGDPVAGFEELPAQTVRGLARPVPIWKLARTS